MFKRSTTVLVVGLMMLGLLAGSALSAPTNNKKAGDLDQYEADQCEWTGSPKQWVCEDDPDPEPQDTTGNNSKNDNGKKWIEDEEANTTSGPGNSGKDEVTTTQTCVYNPGGNLMPNKSHDPDGTCPPTLEG